MLILEKSLKNVSEAFTTHYTIYRIKQFFSLNDCFDIIKNAGDSVWPIVF